MRPQALAAFVATLVAASAGFAQPKEEAKPVEAKPSDGTPGREVTLPGKPPLRVWIASEGVLEASVCKTATACENLTIKLPDAVRGTAGKAVLHARKTSSGKSFVDVEIPVGARVFHALVAQKRGKPSLLWSGTSSERIKIAAGSDGTVVVEESAATCTGSALHSRRELDGSTLEMRMSPGEVPPSTKATVLSGEATAATIGLPLLRGARREERALVDGSETTGATLAEIGPFGTFTTSQKVDVDGVGLTFAAPLAEPRTIALRIGDAVYGLAIPKGFASVAFRLPARTKLRCMSLEIPPLAATGKKSEPRLTTLRLSTPFDGKPMAEIAKELSLGGATGRERADLLAAAGEPGIAAAIAAYESLDGPGRDLARRIIDSASCEQKLKLYVPRLASKDRDEEGRARDRVRRCGKEAAPLLVEAMKSSEGATRALFADELGLLSPGVAVPLLVELLGATEDASERALYRKALSKAAQRDSSTSAFDQVFVASEKLPMRAQIDLIRASAERLGAAPSGAAFWASVTGAATDFSDRYLLLVPSAALAKSGNSAAVSFLSRLLRDEKDHRLRARVAELSADVAPLQNDLLGRATDSEPRVREAAMRSLRGRALDDKTLTQFAAGFRKEPWTFVRTTTAELFLGAKGAPAIDRFLADAVDHDDSYQVRATLVEALGRRGARAETKLLRERAEDKKEALIVRKKATEALGEVCDHDSLDFLTDLVALGEKPTSVGQRDLALAAIAALGRLRPRDLAERLAPVMGAKVPNDIRGRAREAANAKRTCPPAAP